MFVFPFVFMWCAGKYEYSFEFVYPLSVFTNSTCVLRIREMHIVQVSVSVSLSNQPTNKSLESIHTNKNFVENNKPFNK